MTGRLWLVRHGRTAWNRGRFLGRADVGLDDVGRAQAAAAGRRLAGCRADAVWTSPLARARATADTISDAIGSRGGRLDRLVCDDLVELDCGTWEGRPKDRLRISRLPVDVGPPGGESVAAGWARVAPVADRLRDEMGRGRRIVVVGHYLTGQLLRAAVLGRDLAGALDDPAFRPAPGSVHELTPP